MISFIIACLFIELTPGPNMAYLAMLSLSEGRRAGLHTVAGIAVGLFVIAIASALGMAQLIVDFPMLYEIIRWAGVAYMLWLTASCLKENTEISPGQTAASKADLRYFRRGFITNVLNPKAALFYVTVLPGFIDPQKEVLGQVITLACISVAVATVVHLLLVLMASRFQPFINTPGHRRRIRRIFAVLLALIALWLAISTHR